MNRKQFLYSVAGAGVAEAITATASADSTPKPQPALNILSSSILMDAYVSPHLATPTRILHMSVASPRLHVAIRNTSAQPLRIWEEDSSWGSGNLSLEITAIGGSYLAAPIKVVRNVTVWYSNAFTSSLLPPDEMIMRELTLEVPAAPTAKRFEPRWPYKGFPFAEIQAGSNWTGMPKSVTMRAIFEIRPDAQSAHEGVWTGKVTSPECTYALRMNGLD